MKDERFLVRYSIRKSCKAGNGGAKETASYPRKKVIQNAESGFGKIAYIYSAASCKIKE